MEDNVTMFKKKNNTFDFIIFPHSRSLVKIQHLTVFELECVYYNICQQETCVDCMIILIKILTRSHLSNLLNVQSETFSDA